MMTRALVAGALAASMLLSGCVSTVAGIAVRDGHAVPTNVPPLDESALDRVVLSIDDINAIMGTKDIEVTSELDEMTDSSGMVSDPDCLGAMFGAEDPVYDGSGWTAVRNVVGREPEEDNDHWVQQTAVIYPDAGRAKRFFEKSKSTWDELRRILARGGRLGIQLAVGDRRPDRRRRSDHPDDDPGGRRRLGMPARPCRRVQHDRRDLGLRLQPRRRGRDDGHRHRHQRRRVVAQRYIGALAGWNTPELSDSSSARMTCTTALISAR